MKKIITISLIGALSSSSLMANYSIEPTNKVIKKKFEKGWWWYEETIKDKNTTKVIKYKVSPSEKAKIDSIKKTNQLLKTLILQQLETKKLQEKINDRLKYAFPHVTPIYSVNSKGKKCKTNSSADCFMMPVIAEGQQIPVLKKFIRNPSPKNSREWLKWQSKYFNHVTKVSTGLRFAFLKGGSDVYQTQTDYTYGDDPVFSQSEAARGAREGFIIGKLGKEHKLMYFIFLGQNKLYEKLTKTYFHLNQFKNTFLRDVPHLFVFPSKKIASGVMVGLKNEMRKKGYEEIADVLDKSKFIIRPDLFKKYKIRITPTVMIYYQNSNKDKKSVKTQIITSGVFSVDRIRTGTMRFLTYYGIIKPKEIGADKNWNITEHPLDTNLTKLPTAQKIINFDKIDKKIKKEEQEDDK